MKIFNHGDTIVALATAPGTGAIAVIRLSGPDAISITDKLFHPKKKKAALSSANSHSLHFGTIEDDGKIIDEVLVAVMRAPHTYTGEEIVEISCHGSPFIQQQIISLCQSRGARMAGPGEFTLRAFLNRKMDLSQAEAVADLIAADSNSSHQLAMQQMRGGFSNEISVLRKELIHFASLIELELDFAEEDVEFASREDLQNTILKLQLVIHELVESFELGNVIKKGIPVVIAGKPNAGKSTLLNSFLNEERAIVSETAGTTRDTIEEEINLGGVKFRFIDTAGLRETHDAIEKIGVSKAFEKMNESPVILYLFDVNQTTSSALNEELLKVKENINTEVHLIPVANKIDSANEDELRNEFRNFKDLIFISAKAKTNVDSLKNYLVDLYHGGRIESNHSIVTSARHADALKKTAEALANVYNGLSSKVTNDFLAGDLRIALMHLGEITGEISTEDLLENIFMRFCIGK